MAEKKLFHGLIVGVILGFIFSCMRSTQTTYFPWGPLIITTIICAAIGYYIGWQQDKEEEELQNQENERIAKENALREERRQKEIKRQEEERRFQDWSDRVHLQFRKIEKSIGPGYSPENAYNAIWQLRDQMFNEPRYNTEFNRQYQEHCQYLRSNLRRYLRREMGLGGLAAAVSAAECLVKAEPDNRNNPIAVNQLTEALSVAIQPLCFVNFDGYGECYFLLDKPGAMEVAAGKADALLSRFAEAEKGILEGRNDIVQHIVQYISADLIMDQCMLMWYYANKKPFDVNSFEKARTAFLMHTALYCKDAGAREEMKAYSVGDEEFKIIALGKVEEVLARIYSKNQIGGAGTVRQEKDYIDFWLSQRIKSEDYEDCYLLASGLAWMELYELELDVLRKLVAADVQLPTDMQERLSFLESGGTVNIKLYDVDLTKGFCFDNSSIDWKAKEFAVFFRKMAMKKTCVKYSMAISKWTKTLPLMSGQKISKDHLYQEFLKLVEDFDGEIICEKTNAVAINLANVEYEDAILFRFTNKKNQRNRCVSVLFSCEKFGRNLNLTILTLFTPEEAVPYDQLEKYCLAIKDNVYVESFRESILQVVDDAIKIKQSVYGDDEMPRKKMVFPEED